MSNLKEAIVLSVTIKAPGADDMEVLPSPMMFRLNANMLGSYGYTTTNPTATVTYDLEKLNTATTIGHINVGTDGVFIFDTTSGLPVYIEAGDVLGISTADASTVGAIGLSIVGER